MLQELIREEPQGWIDVTDPLFSNDGKIFLDIVPLLAGDGSLGEWFHLAQYIRGTGGSPSPGPQAVTVGQKTVISIVGWNQDLGLM